MTFSVLPPLNSTCNRTFKTMSDLIAEASLAMRPTPEATRDSGEESSEGTSFPDPLWVQFFKTKWQENR